VEFHAADQAADADQEADPGEGGAAFVEATRPSAAKGTGQLRVFRREGGLELVEESLLVLREGHRCLLVRVVDEG